VKGRLLIVDDEFMIRELLSSALSKEGYHCITAGDTTECVQVMAQHEVDLTLLDIMMPGSSGIQLLPQLKQQHPDTAILMVTAVSDIETALSCMSMGADDYIVKPFSLDRILITVQNSLEKRRLTMENREYQNNLEQKVREQTLQIKQAMEDLHRSYEFTLSALVRALDAREKEVGSHSERVKNYTLLLGTKCGVSEPELSVMAKGTLLHDIGKIGVPDKILLKGSPLNNDEWLEMRKHPVVGYEILSGVSTFREVSGFVLSHHEKYDGTGYPHGLKGDQIPLSARIFTFADTLDAMTSDRPYRKALPFRHVIDEIKRCKGSQFDPHIADTFLSIPQSSWEQAGQKAFL
jgi:putative two-component system response regulator